MRSRVRFVAPAGWWLVVVGSSLAAAPAAFGQFVFESADRERVGRSPRALAIADFDEDGFLDLICGDVDDTLTVLLNDGGRSFAVAATMTVAAPTSVVTADFDANGHADFFATSEIGREATVGLGDGAGGFAPLVSVPLALDPWESIAADFDGDGRIDVAVGGGGAVEILFGDGRGGFAKTETIPLPSAGDVLALRAADLDGDGSPELVAAALPEAMTGAARVAILGRTDAIDLVTRLDFSAPLRWPASVVAADANGDGRVDLLFTSFIGDAPQLFAGEGLAAGEIAFADPVPVLGANVLYAAAHDFDRDGRVDVAATGGYPGDLRLFRGDGKGSFALEARLPTGAAPRRLEIADLDVDGLADVATANWRDGTAGTVTTFLNRTMPASRSGTVNRGAGRVADVLFVNDSAGGPERVVRLASWEGLFIFMNTPPLAGRPVAFALRAWPGAAPPLDEERAMPHGIGVGARALLDWQGGARPAVVWNSTGVPALGRGPRPSGPAPWMVVERRAGLGRPMTFFLQGVIEDPGSAGERPASVTNAVTVEIR